MPLVTESWLPGTVSPASLIRVRRGDANGPVFPSLSQALPCVSALVRPVRTRQARPQSVNSIWEQHHERNKSGLSPLYRMTMYCRCMIN